MHSCPENSLAIGRAVVLYAGLPTHLVQGSNVRKVQLIAIEMYKTRFIELFIACL